MDIFVPFDAVDPKRRLAPVLDSAERGAFAEAMLVDVLETLEAAGATPRVLSTAPMDLDWAVVVDERPLTKATNALLRMNEPPLGIVMADLPLVTPSTIDRLLEQEADLVLVPGIGGGTNAIVVNTPDFVVDFHGCSIEDHRAYATSNGLAVSEVDSYQLSLDVDEPNDLVEVLLHSDGAANRWLRAHGFAVVEDDHGRVVVKRTPRD